MSNMQQYGGGGGGGGGGKNPPWARNNKNQQISNMQQQPMMNQNQIPQANMMQYQQTQPVYQSGMMQQNKNNITMMQQNSMNTIGQNLGPQMNQNQMFSQGGVVTYSSPRNINHNTFCQTSTINQNPPQVQQNNSSPKQRVFAGTVTKAHDEFGFVDEDVFFQLSACVKGSHPIVGDRVLVEASYNPSMPFKWNATRIQVLPSNKPSLSSRRDSSKNKGYNNSNISNYSGIISSDNPNYGNNQRRSRDRKSSPRKEDRGRNRDNANRQSEENDRKRKSRGERDKERRKEKSEDKDKVHSPSSRSTKLRRRVRPVARYLVQVPKIALDIPTADVLEIKRRYGNLYIPSDFFNTKFRWIDAFPPHSPFSLNKPCVFHIMHKEIDNPVVNEAALDPSDVDYLFSAKVMLLSMPNLEDVYNKCCALEKEEKEKKESLDERDFIHPTRLINFLVGLRGKNETMAIGGPWSPSLDGPNPESDPSVLIKTAIRACKAHTGIDLSNCTQWYRFVELYYRRAESVHRGRIVPARVETVVIFVPDVWSCLPTRLEWDNLITLYKNQGEAGPAAKENAANLDQIEKPANDTETENKEPTHYSELDPKTMSLGDLKKELLARGVSNKGLKSQLIARLAKLVKAEACQDDAAAGDSEVMDVEEIEPEADTDSTGVITIDDQNVEENGKKSDEENKPKTAEKEKSLWKSRNVLPDHPHVIVHPSRTAKSGKFDCTMMTLSLLLDYRPEDSKEHSFEVSLFAELFNEMLMRDFGFNIYKALYKLPDKPKDEKEDKKKDADSKQKSSDKSDDKKDLDGKKSDKKDEKVKRDKDDATSVGDEESSSDKKYSSDSKKDKKDKLKLITKDPHLLLSFVYFDTSHCGYIFEKDMEELLYTLGLNLSRAQVRKLVAKVVSRESFHYRQLTDKPKDEEVLTIDQIEELDLEEMGTGNKKLLKVFKTQKEQEEEEAEDTDENPAKRPRLDLQQRGMVEYKGSLLDIEKLLSQLKRSEQARLDTEVRLVELKNENSELVEKQARSSAMTQALQVDLEDSKKNLRETQGQLSRMTMSSKIFHLALKEIQTKVVSVIHTKMYDDPDNMKNAKSDGSASRWSDELKLKKEFYDGNASDSDSKSYKEDRIDIKIEEI